MTSVGLASTSVALAAVERLRAFGERPALFDGRWITYSDLADMVADRTSQLGPRPTVVAVPERRDADTVAWMLAALGGGHVLLMLDAAGTQILDTYQPECVVRDGILFRTGPVMPVHPELSMLLSTSGSTGSPKLVRLSAQGIDANATAIAEYLGLTAEDRTITSLPLSYCYGLSLLTSHVATGAALVLTDLSVVDRCFWDLAAATGVSTLAGVPHTFDLLDRTGFNGRETLPSLRRVTQAGGRMTPDHVQRYARLAQSQAWDFYVMYGQTEATARIAYLPPHLAVDHPDCVGVAVPGGDLRIDNGEVVFTGPSVMMGYAQGPADLAGDRETTELRTGDLGEFTDDGLLRITGRAANRAKIFGLRLDLDHVESLIPGAVVFVKEQTLVVVTSSDPAEVAALVAQRTGLPHSAVFAIHRTDVPRLSSGKVDRQALLASIQLPAEADSAGDLLTAVKQALAVTLRRERVGDDDTFVSLGGDSMAYVAAAVRLERIVGHLPRGWHLLTVRELAGSAVPNRPGWSVVEMPVLLRALAVVLVVGSHTTVFDVRGGAHLLLGLAGYNFARFVLPTRQRAARMGRALASFLVPAALWLALVVATSQEYGMSVLGVTFSDREAIDPAWRYWFIEVFAIALVLAGLLAVPRRMVTLERRSPLIFAASVLAATLVARELLAGQTVPTSLFTLAASLWVFALGWLLAVMGQGWLAKSLASALVLALVVPFFEKPTRDLVVGLGLVLLVWVPGVRLPKPLVAVLSAVAAASLVIYLTHWQVYPPFDQWPVLAAVVSLAFGVAAHCGLRRLGLMR